MILKPCSTWLLSQASEWAFGKIRTVQYQGARVNSQFLYPITNFYQTKVKLIPMSACTWFPRIWKYGSRDNHAIKNYFLFSTLYYYLFLLQDAFKRHVSPSKWHDEDCPRLSPNPVRVTEKSLISRSRSLASGLWQISYTMLVMPLCRRCIEVGLKKRQTQRLAPDCGWMPGNGRPGAV